MQHDLKYLKDPKGVYPKMPVQLFLEEGLATWWLLLFPKTLILKKNSCNEVKSAIADKGKKQATEWYEANKVLVDS
jgi:hypothetical protein